jgi:hypothetical protein
LRARLLFALGFVLVVSALIVLRDKGLLGGREDGGPLRIATAHVGKSAKPGEAVRFDLDGTLQGRPVRVQNVRSRIVSPELVVLGPTIGGRQLEDATLSGATQRAAMSLRAERPGLYYALGLIVDYRRGQRRFREREPQSLCIAVRTGARCNLGYRGPHDARVAQVGGPSRYRRARLTASAAHYDAPGEYALLLTLANQTRSAIDVSDLAFDRNGLGVAITSAEPADFELAPHGYRVVRLRARLPACRPFHTIFDRLRARLDGERRSIPLSLALDFGC